jgi:enamine deaminase RidA (YjgF/YER057c/UK114 family)
MNFGGKAMKEIFRGDINEEYAYSGYVIAGDYVFLNFCVGNVGKSIREQVEGALNNMEERLKEINLTLEDVVKVDVLFRDIWNIPIMRKYLKKDSRVITLQEKVFQQISLM